MAFVSYSKYKQKKEELQRQTRELDKRTQELRQVTNTAVALQAKACRDIKKLKSMAHTVMFSYVAHQRLSKLNYVIAQPRNKKLVIVDASGDRFEHLEIREEISISPAEDGNMDVFLGDVGVKVVAFGKGLHSTLDQTRAGLPMHIYIAEISAGETVNTHCSIYHYREHRARRELCACRPPPYIEGKLEEKLESLPPDGHRPPVHTIPTDLNQCTGYAVVHIKPQKGKPPLT